MKLRNKKTGEIMDDVQYRNYSLSDGFGFRMNGKEWEYHSLAELNEEWEDYEEPKEYWYIDTYICERNCQTEGANVNRDNFNKEIGNYFDTREEAEKAVEKLKAWKRLRDKGFGFLGVKGLDYAIDFEINPPYTHITFDEYTATEEQKEFYNDLMLLFGGEK